MSSDQKPSIIFKSSPPDELLINRKKAEVYTTRSKRRREFLICYFCQEKFQCLEMLEVHQVLHKPRSRKKKEITTKPEEKMEQKFSMDQSAKDVDLTSTLKDRSSIKNDQSDYVSTEGSNQSQIIPTTTEDSKQRIEKDIRESKNEMKEDLDLTPRVKPDQSEDMNPPDVSNQSQTILTTTKESKQVEMHTQESEKEIKEDIDVIRPDQNSNKPDESEGTFSPEMNLDICKSKNAIKTELQTKENVPNYDIELDDQPHSCRKRKISDSVRKNNTVQLGLSEKIPNLVDNQIAEKMKSDWERPESHRLIYMLNDSFRLISKPTKRFV